MIVWCYLHMFGVVLPDGGDMIGDDGGQKSRGISDWIGMRVHIIYMLKDTNIYQYLYVVECMIAATQRSFDIHYYEKTTGYLA